MYVVKIYKSEKEVANVNIPRSAGTCLNIFTLQVHNPALQLPDSNSASRCSKIVTTPLPVFEKLTSAQNVNLRLNIKNV